ncbi:MAG: 5-formyltetrahydrofolate cyclo-ligase [Pyrinomonadaceae bacterium]
MTKSELRKIYLAKRETLADDELALKSRQIADRFFESFNLQPFRFLHCFIPIPKFNEIDTSLIYKRIWAEFPLVQTVAPLVDFETGGIENLEFDAKTELIENAWGVREPARGSGVEVAEIDMVLVPLLCFDKNGFRVGYGKGFYDKFLSRCRPECLKIGLSYFLPVDNIEDLGANDIALNIFVTPEKLYRPQIKKDRSAPPYF